MKRLPSRDESRWCRFSPKRSVAATACDGIFYQIPAGDNAPNPAPGVLPI